MSVGIENIVLIPGENILEGYGLFGDHGVKSLIFDVHKISRAAMIIKGITEGENFLAQVKAKHNQVKNKNKQPVVGN